jgi:hypothetical protein
MESSSKLSSLHASARLARGCWDHSLDWHVTEHWGGEGSCLGRDVQRHGLKTAYEKDIGRPTCNGTINNVACMAGAGCCCDHFIRDATRRHDSKRPLPRRRDEGYSGRRPDAVGDCGPCSLMKRPRSSAASISNSVVRPARCKCCLPGQKLGPTFQQSAAVGGSTNAA